MRKGNFLLSVLLIGLLFSACSKGIVFNEKHEFKDQKWNNFDALTFKVKIDNIEDSYNIYLNLQHTGKFLYPDLMVLVTIDDPSETSRNYYSTFKIQDKDNHFLGTAKDDLYNLEIKTKEYFFFNEKGEYTFTIQNSTHYFEMLGIKNLGLKVEKAKIDYDIE